jgi:cytochrome P450
MLPTVSSALLVGSLFVLPALLISTQLLKIRKKYLQAQSLGLPVFISVSTWQNPIWALLHPYFLWMQHLPFGLVKGVKYSYFGWTDVDKGRTHVELGNAFCVVSPNRLEIVCAEPTVCMEVLQKWRVWTKSKEVYEMFNTFGRNLNSVNGQDWQRHRKITGQAFREETYDLVHRESRKQAEQLLRAIEKRGQGDLVHLRNDFALVAMHVLSSAVFGHSYDYGAGLQEVEVGHKMSYFASLAFILQNIMAVVVFKSLSAPDWLLPAYFRKLKLSVNEFQQYLTEAAEQEQKAGMTKRSGASLVTALLQANEDAKHQAQKSGGLPMHLTDEELYGNMYLFNLAGFETTSFSLGFTIPHLAIDPSLQGWIQEEIDLVIKSGKADDYNTAFSQLPRCRALMFETLRHHAAAAVVPRLSPSDQPTDVYFPSMDKTIIIPPDSYVTVNVRPHSSKTHVTFTNSVS